MEPRHLLPYSARMLASARALDAAIRSEDPELIAQAFAAIGRVRSRLGPAIANMTKQAEWLARKASA